MHLVIVGVKQGALLRLTSLPHSFATTIAAHTLGLFIILALYSFRDEHIKSVRRVPVLMFLFRPPAAVQQKQSVSIKTC